MPDLELRERLAAYAADRASLADFEAWLTDESVVADEFEAAARALLFDSLRLISEFHNGDWSETELRERLGVLGRTYWFEQAPKIVYADSSSGLIREDRQSAAAERLRATESA